LRSYSIQRSMILKHCETKVISWWRRWGEQWGTNSLRRGVTATARRWVARYIWYGTNQLFHGLT
jgi:hypothetical protein